jgi:DNA polymerase (family 10)
MRWENAGRRAGDAAHSGLKPDRIRKLHTDLGISSVAELEEAARSDKLEILKGYGPAFQAKVLQGIEMSRRPQGRHIHRAAAALSYASPRSHASIQNWTMVTPAGEFRRGCELVGTLAIVAVDPNGEERTLTQGDQLMVHVASRERYGITLLLATGLGAAHRRAAKSRHQAKAGVSTNGLAPQRQNGSRTRKRTFTTRWGCPSSRRSCARPAKKCTAHCRAKSLNW